MGPVKHLSLGWCKRQGSTTLRQLSHWWQSVRGVCMSARGVEESRVGSRATLKSPRTMWMASVGKSRGRLLKKEHFKLVV